MFEGFTTFTWIHTIFSLVMLGSGIVVMTAMLRSQRRSGWSIVFFLTGLATSATGFGFPLNQFLPSHWIGVVSLIVLAIAVLARYAFFLAGTWRPVYVIGTVTALYLDVFVFIVQLFRKIPALRALAPTESEPPFVVVQLVALVIFVVLAIAAVRKFHPPPSTWALRQARSA
jgi:hypothetical protein